MGKLNKQFKTMINTVKREKLLFATNVIVMTVTFLVLGLFITIIFVSQSALKHLESQAQVTVFFKDDFPEENILNLMKSLEQDERVLGVNYVSKEDAYRIFMELNKDEPILLESISKDILPASLEVKTKGLSQLPELSSEMEETDGVEEVRFFRDVIERFRRVSAVIYGVGLGMVLLFIVLSFAVIMVTLRMTISSKGVEISIQKLVGATDKFVKSPLVFQSTFVGLLSSLIAFLILFLTAVAATLVGVFSEGLLLPFVANVSISYLLFTVLLGVVLLISGIFLGYAGSVVAVKKYLEY